VNGSNSTEQEARDHAKTQAHHHCGKSAPLRRGGRPSIASRTSLGRSQLEEVRAQNQMVLEAVVAHQERTDRQATEAAERFAGLGAQVVALEVRMDRRLDAVDHRLNGVDERLAALRQDVRELSTIVARKADAATLGALDHRVTRLERRAKI